MLVVSIGGSPSLRSRSGVLLERSRQWLQDRGVEVVTFQVRDFPAEDLLHARFDSPHVQHFQQLVAQADGLPLMPHNVFFQDDYAGEFRDIAAGRLPAHGTVYICAQDRDTAAALRAGATEAIDGAAADAAMALAFITVFRLRHPSRV